MLLSNTFYLKVINNGGEGYRSVLVGPESWGEFNRLISVLIQIIFKYVMCNYFSLWNTIHDLSNINIDFSVVGNVSEVISIDNFLGYDFKGKLYIFVTVHWYVEIKFDMSAHKVWLQVLIWCC